MTKKTNKEETALVPLDEQLAALMQQTVEQEAATGEGRRFLSIRGGQLSMGGDAIPGNEIAVAIVDAIHENVYYEGRFDPDEKQAPSCFAFGRSPDEMAPHETSAEPVSDTCKGCPNNEFGSADVGKGKACKNRRRLALLAVGGFDRDGNFEPFDAATIASDDVAYLPVPVTSVTSFAKYAKGLAKVHGKPLQAVATRVFVESDPKYQVRVGFELLEDLGPDVVREVLAKHKVVKDEIDFPYVPRDEEPAEPKKAKRRRASKY